MRQRCIRKREAAAEDRGKKIKGGDENRDYYNKNRTLNTSLFKKN